MKEIIDVPTGKVEVAAGQGMLHASAIGSCVVVSAYCLKKKVGGLAHVMLAGSTPERRGASQSTPPEKTKYAVQAVEEMLSRMDLLGVDPGNISVCLVGGANVLKREGDTTGKDNIDSVKKILRKKNIPIKAYSSGGTTRRSVSLDIETGSVFCTQGDEDEKLLWTAEG